jgi:hypothetical protein
MKMLLVIRWVGLLLDKMSVISAVSLTVLKSVGAGLLEMSFIWYRVTSRFLITGGGGGLVCSY